MRLGSWYELDRRRYGLVVDLSEGVPPASAHASVLRRVSLDSAPWLPGAAGPRVVTVSLERG